MREELQAVCTEFIKDRELAKEAFAWESSYLYPICAGILADKRQDISAVELQQYKRKIKDKTGIFSDFRGSIMAPMACMLAVSEDADKLLEDALAVHELLKKHFWSSSYLPLVSTIVARLADPSQYAHMVEKTSEIYQLMKKEHPFLTSGEDGPFAAMLAFAERSPQGMIAEVEKCYGLLKDKFFSGNAVQSLSHVLALGEGSAESKCSRLETLFNALKARGYKYGTDYELSTLGALSILDVDLECIVEELIQVTDYLETQKGYGLLGATKRQRMMHAAMLVSSTHMEKGAGYVMNSASISSTISMIAAQQAAMCAVVAATAAANASN